ncbi:hypothetical protein [Flavobacterium sp.]|uniref:hypothetical protein n=1 Tax=Flavobacterium sp. TaxID=239 RepID=UPI0037505C18
MISINTVYKTVLTLTNSDIRGNVKPSDVRLAVNDVVNEIIEEYFFEVNRMLNRENRGLVNGGYENLSDRVREKIAHFLKEEVTMIYANPYFNLPADLRYIESVWVENNNEVEFCKSNQEFKLISNYKDTLPKITSPIGLLIRNKVKIAPATVVANVTISYLRKPLIANWTYTIVNNSELFNPSASDFQDIDLHPSEENNVVLRTLKRFGINLKEEDLSVGVANKENQNFNQENAS